MNTFEGNKLIAEFMDLETPDGCYFEYITKEGERSKPTHFILLEYHLSWDWLMPVIGKLNTEVSELTQNLEEESWYSSDLIGEDVFDLSMAMLDDDIVAAYANVLIILEWCNENKK